MARTRLPHIFIIEGIPGSGKNTLTTTLVELLHKDARPVYHYPEEALGFSYTH
jgi:thymidylate kinase